VINEFQHDIFELITLKLSVSDTYTSMGDQFLNHGTQLLQIVDPIVNKEYLSTAINFISYCFFDQCFVEYMKFGLYRDPIGWRCTDDAQITCTHQGEM